MTTLNSTAVLIKLNNMKLNSDVGSKLKVHPFLKSVICYCLSHEATIFFLIILVRECRNRWIPVNCELIILFTTPLTRSWNMLTNRIINFNLNYYSIIYFVRCII